MKKIKIMSFALVISLAALFGFSSFQGGIKGKIIPTDGAAQVWAISSNDTLKAGITQGAFEITNVRAGTYRVYIDAVDPYKDVVRDGVQVSDGGIADLGEIQLEK